MKNEDIKKLDNDQLNEVTGGKWDEENQWPYEDGIIEEMGGRTATDHANADTQMSLHTAEA